MKVLRLKNIVVRYDVNGDRFNIFAGKGHGQQIASVSNMETVQKFDRDFKDLIYKHIIQKSTGKYGGAYFYRGTDKMVDENHPFFNDFEFS